MASNGSAAVVEAAAPLVVPRRLPLRSDGTRLMTLSASSLALFWGCPERWRRRHLERRREPRSGPMVVGGAVGAAITAHYAARLAGERLSRTDADDLLGAEFDDRAAHRLTRFGDDDPALLREQGREALRAYLTTLARDVRPLSVERRFELRFEGAEWSFSGYLDVEDERGPVIDVKLGAKHVSQARADSDPQAGSYLLARLAEGRPAPRFDFHSIRRGPMRSGERCLVVPTDRSESQLAAFERRIAQTARQIVRCVETGDWPLASPDAWWCADGQCSFWASCPAGDGAT
jgi:hypothetical protein